MPGTPSPQNEWRSLTRGDTLSLPDVQYSPSRKEKATPGQVCRTGRPLVELDAFGLAERLLIGAIKRKVYKKPGEFGALRHRVKAYTLLVRDSVRVQDRIKSLFQGR